MTRIVIDLADIITNTHALYDVRGAECDYSAEVTCTCKWEGSPSDYSKHLLVELGFEARVIEDWRRYLGRPALLTPLARIGKEPLTYADPTYPEVTPIQREDYLNMFRDPKKKRRITKEERKADTLAEPT